MNVHALFNFQSNKLETFAPLICLSRSGVHRLIDKLEPRGESWRAWASEREVSVQAGTVGLTALGVDRVVAYKAQTYCLRLEGLVPWFFRNPSWLDNYEFLNRFL
jgi:hypothetical protein